MGVDAKYGHPEEFEKYSALKYKLDLMEELIDIWRNLPFIVERSADDHETDGFPDTDFLSQEFSLCSTGYAGNFLTITQTNWGILISDF